MPLRRDTTNPDIRKYSPTGRVPVLEIEEGGETVTVFDSLAICETLAERHPDARLWPDDANARALARSYSCEMHSSFVPLRSVLPMDIALSLPTPELNDGVKADIARIIAAWTEALTRYGKEAASCSGAFRSPIACMRRWSRACAPMASQCRRSSRTIANASSPCPPCATGSRRRGANSKPCRRPRRQSSDQVRCAGGAVGTGMRGSLPASR